MVRIGSQDYRVVRADFPIKIEMEAFDLAALQGEPSSVVVTRPDGTKITEFELRPRSVANKPLARRYEIPDPKAPNTPVRKRYEPPAEVNFVFAIGFATPNGVDPRYELRMNAASGDKDSRIVKPPNLKISTHFEYR